MRNTGFKNKEKDLSSFTSHLLSPRGFTLIELVVVFAVIGILTTLGIASYSTYNGLQSVQSATSDVINLLNNAKSRAISQSKPSSCGSNSLTGYQVDIPATGQDYTLSAVCGSKQTVTSSLLPTQVKFANGSPVSVFFSLASGTVANTTTITLNGYNKTKTITVSKTGSITVN